MIIKTIIDNSYGQIAFAPGFVLVELKFIFYPSGTDSRWMGTKRHRFIP